MGLVNDCNVVPSKESGVCVDEHERMRSVQSANIRAQYEPFMSGFVCLAGCEMEEVKILRDTGASRTLILESVLPFDTTSSAGASVLLKGIGDDFVEAPLHVVDLKSGLASGMVTMAVRPSLPVIDVDIMLGNDIAGERVVPVSFPIVSSIPYESSETDQLVAEFPTVFPACAVTRSMARKVRSEKECNDIDVDLQDSFFLSFGG